ncbi:MAG TPA: MarR family transcriptional regulator [Pedomonas sp.]|uniref:MarR family winged helix-turn-helix transcriptional regulator n=1 Tax=Pedomonas sp. TaxID=2976421 RepID=UPI002F3EE231
MNNEITTSALRAIRRILRAADLNGRMLSGATGLTPSQLMVLQEIERRGETTPSAVAAALQFSQATVTNIVDRLVEGDLATRQRSERDKRQMILRVTPRGQDVLFQAPDLLQQRFRGRFEELPAWEQAMILAALERLSDLLEAGDIDAAPLIDAGVIDRSR